MPWWCPSCLRAQSADIKQLNYQHSSLNDVPAEVFAFERTLEELYLDSNRIRDLPRPLFHCHGLKILSISDNEIHSLPPAVASLINLQHLDVSRNALSGIPDNLKGCKHLVYVDVSVNPLEKLPEGFTQLISLEELYLNDTYLDFLPANFGRLMKLKILELRENNLNTLPKSIARLINLQRLDIGQNDFSDLPEVIGSLVNLTELWIDSNRIRCIPTFIGNLRKLVHLEASNNNIRWIAPEIEHCSKLMDLTMTCNELREIPESIGNLKELVTLKLDDNQISHLPNAIGDLVSLEELVLSQNDLECLNPCIGLLRKLHILNVDDNMLEELPSEIGSCSSMTILSAHSNKLQYVPAELGHLSNLRVVNLSENHLQSLPVSVLNLVNLTALWLSNNQSTPLTTLQQEIDHETGQTVCVNFMLPQSSQGSYFHDVRYGRCMQSEDQPVKTKQHITFATDSDVEAPSRLLRAPTPYPKELRAMAKHARAIHHPRKSSKESDEDTPLLGEMVSQEPKDLLIKEAKVKKPGTASAGDVSTNITTTEKIQSGETNESEGTFKNYSDGDKVVPQYEHMVYAVHSQGDDTPVVATDSGPIVREAKCIRRLSNPIPILSEGKQRQSVASNNDQSVLQPPPYHIAAAYSKQAMFFRQGDLQNQGPSIMHLLNEEKPANMIYCKREGFEVSQTTSENFNNIISRKCDEVCFPRVEEKEVSVALENGSGVYVTDENKNDSSSRYQVEKTDFLQNSMRGTPNSQESGLTDSLGGDEEKSSSSSQFHLAPSNASISKDEMFHTTISPTSKTVHNNLDLVKTFEDPSYQVLAKCSTENTEGDEDYHDNNGNQFPDSFGQSANKTQMHDNKVFLMQKPQTFTQDKPVVSEGVVAPTPHRPGSPSSPNSPLIDSIGFLASTPVSSLSSQNNNLRKPSGIPKAVSRTNSTSPDSYTHSKDHKSNRNVWQSPVSTRIPQPVFYSNTTPSYASSRRSSVSSVPSTCELSNTMAETQKLSNDKSNMILSSELYHTPPQNHFNNPNEINYFESTSPCDGGGNMQFHLSHPSESENVCASPNLVETNPDLSHSGHSNTSMKIPTSPVRALQSLSAAQSRIPAPTRLPTAAYITNQKTRTDMQGKHTKAWFFGPHRNPTVFPVVIQKNPGLGFSISGGTKLSASDKHELGIFVTKVHPSGAAHGMLLPGDKILEVEGVDFTKLDHEQAVQVLRTTSNTVHMMISRQQT